jgi:hypothetical protein
MHMMDSTGVEEVAADSVGSLRVPGHAGGGQRSCRAHQAATSGTRAQAGSMDLACAALRLLPSMPACCVNRSCACHALLPACCGSCCCRSNPSPSGPACAAASRA